MQNKTQRLEKQGAKGLANFFLIDQSLKKLGGHHYDYVRCVAAAAQEQGFKTTIGTNRCFREIEGLLKFGDIKREFTNTTYLPESYLTGLRHLTRSNSNSALKQPAANIFRRLLDRTRSIRQQKKRDKAIRRFAIDCENFFRTVLFTERDHIFFTTVNEIELMGLAAFLSNQPRTLQASWHLQFHFNLFEGRTPEYESQNDVARLVQGCFDAAIARIPFHQLHFYSTSEALADQYNRLGVGEFKVLAYPVRPELFGAAKGSAKPNPSRPLRLTCPGEVRREKRNAQYLQPLVNDIWERHLATGQVQLVVQRPVRKWPAREKIVLHQPDHSSPAKNEWIQYAKHPLGEKEYLKLLEDTDCGLLFYDSRAYYSRRAGVLGELLSCGKPVIVPAGCWLADQIQDSVFRHVQQTCKGNVVRTLELEKLRWSSDNVPLPGGTVSFGQDRHPFEFEFEIEPESMGFSETDEHGDIRQVEDAFVVQFDWHWPDSPGIYCRIESSSFDALGHPISRRTQVVGHDSDGISAVAMFPLERRAALVKIKLRNAFHDSTASVRSLRLHGIASGRDGVPIGGVGVIAADQSEIPSAVDEIVEHFAHYQTTALQFANQWCSKHEPSRTLSHLVSKAQSGMRAA